MSTAAFAVEYFPGFLQFGSLYADPVTHLGIKFIGGLSPRSVATALACDPAVICTMKATQVHRLLLPTKHIHMLPQKMMLEIKQASWSRWSRIHNKRRRPETVNRWRDSQFSLAEVQKKPARKIECQFWRLFEKATQLRKERAGHRDKIHRNRIVIIQPTLCDYSSSWITETRH